jgi:hypothetical protein
MAASAAGDGAGGGVDAESAGAALGFELDTSTEPAGGVEDAVVGGATAAGGGSPPQATTATAANGNSAKNARTSAERDMREISLGEPRSRLPQEHGVRPDFLASAKDVRKSSPRHVVAERFSQPMRARA